MSVASKKQGHSAVTQRQAIADMHSNRQIPDVLLTVEAAAKLMRSNKPYVAMLIDQKLLPGALVTEGGQRCVPESSVRAWIADHDIKASQADYRAAATEAGMYDIPEKVYIDSNLQRRP